MESPFRLWRNETRPRLRGFTEIWEQKRSRTTRGVGILLPGVLSRVCFPAGKPETKRRQRALFFEREPSGGTFVLRDGEGRRSPTGWFFNADLGQRAHLRSLRN